MNSYGHVGLVSKLWAGLDLLKRLTNTKCTYFPKLLTTAILEPVVGEMEVCGWTRYRIQTLWLLGQAPYRMHYVAHRFFFFNPDDFGETVDHLRVPGVLTYYHFNINCCTLYANTVSPL